jgi:predicted O-methyltransferase YrrM
MTPMYFKSSFWLNVPHYHRDLYSGLFATAFRNSSDIARFKKECPIGEIFQGCRFAKGLHLGGYPMWYSSFKDIRKNIRSMLEIGSFEGKSTLFFAWLFPNARISCIDPFADYVEVEEHMSDVYSRFLANTKRISDRVQLLRGYSTMELPKLVEQKQTFDLIFIDGSHHYDDVIADSNSAWACLEPGGYLVWDDYLWKRRVHAAENPKKAIDEFLSDHKGQYQVIFAFKQVAIRKL